MQNPERSIVLVGFMATGKSSVGRLLAAERGWPIFDTDEMIMQALGMPIARIFAELGEERFRAEESAALERLGTTQPLIIVTGGGIVLRPANVARLRQLGTVVWLTADLPTLWERLDRRPNRPLLQTENPEETAQKLLGEREPLYRTAADFTINTSSLSHAQVAQSIRDALALIP